LTEQETFSQSDAAFQYADDLLTVLNCDDAQIANDLVRRLIAISYLQGQDDGIKSLGKSLS
jgi:hypothetical protein